jgi:hypothetical protein
MFKRNRFTRGLGWATGVWLGVVAGRVRVSTGQDVGTLAALLATPPVKAALAAAKASESRTLDDQVRFCEVAAPPFKESARGDLLKRAF